MKRTIKRRQFIEKSVRGAAFLGLGGGNLLIQGCSKARDWDLLVSGGAVYDGLGNPGQEIDIAIKGDSIVLIGQNLDKSSATYVIEADGLAVSPGFIDVHTHTDVELIANPKAESFIRQGITTEISGNCGFSPFPIADAIFDEEKERLKDEYDIDLDWRDIHGFFRRLEERGIAHNYATLLGQGAVRGEVIGFDDEPPAANDLLQMRALVEENMKAGALGLSTGLEYAPGSYAETPEIIELCREVAKYNGVYATHMRDEGDLLLESIDEAIDIARETGVSLQISHFKIAYPRNWPKVDAAISKIEEAHEDGIDILADRYPYIAGSTSLSFYFPLWALQGTTADFIGRLRNPDLDGRLRNNTDEQERKLGSWDKVVICSVFTEKNKPLEGMNILEAAARDGKAPYDFMRDLIIEEDNRVGMITFMMNEPNLQRILSHSLVVIGSDGSAVAPYGILHKGKPHPRFYGSFPRVLGKYAREEGIFPLSQAIRKITSLPAEKFGLDGRGQVRENYFADLVLFDPDTVIDEATWTDPHQYPTGIEYVIVNGKVVVSEGEHTGATPGIIIRK
ncbi:MAG: D-aminoacylase [Candidatus Latescibacteria bacterium]|nr:D-aminoacylase [Candidatus Latescibacterota bacterium]